MDVESNHVDYEMQMWYVNYGPRYDEESDYGMRYDIGAPVQGVCANFSASSGASTTSLPAVPCGPVVIPPGAMLSAGTVKVPGGVCTGDTVMKLVNATDNTDLQAPGSDNYHNAVANNGASSA